MKLYNENVQLLISKVFSFTKICLPKWIPLSMFKPSKQKLNQKSVDVNIPYFNLIQIVASKICKIFKGWIESYITKTANSNNGFVIKTSFVFKRSPISLVFHKLTLFQLDSILNASLMQHLHPKLIFLEFQVQSHLSIF